ncbi:MAG: hypothetical protein JXR84_04095 [Anaerolineae bacterium]|nr:hypothetical protein [Anaerolineae bacterium]
MSTVKYDTMWQVNQARYERLLDEARNERATRKSQSDHAPRRLAGLGDLLVSLGLRLKANYKPAAH